MNPSSTSPDFDVVPMSNVGNAGGFNFDVVPMSNVGNAGGFNFDVIPMSNVDKGDAAFLVEAERQ